MPYTLLYFIAIFGLASASPFIRLAAAPLEIIGFWRLSLCALCFAPFVLKKAVFKNEKAPWAALSGVVFFAHLWTFFFATQTTSIANSMILYSTNPLFTALGAYLFFKEKLPRRVIFAYALAVTGIYQLVSHNLSFAPEHLPGDLAALLSGVLLSAFVLTGNHARKTMPNVDFSFVVYLVVGILFGLTAWIRGEHFTAYPPVTWWSILALVVFPTLMGHVLFMYLLRHMNINLMSCGKLLEPVLAAVAAYFLFGEELTANTWLAFLLTASSILILFFPWGKLRKWKWLKFWLETES